MARTQLDKSLLKLEGILSKINTHPEYSSRVRAKHLKFLDDEANRHSVHIEEDVAEEIALQKKGSPDFYARLESAWEYLREHGLSIGTYSALGKIVAPDANTGNFRDKPVTFGRYSPPENSQQIVPQVKELMYFLQDPSNSPIIRACEAHIETIRIHPFVDGNGRIARLVQNFILRQHGYTPATIPASERGIYIQLINDVHDSRFGGVSSMRAPSDAENRFYTFLVSKIIGTAENLEQQLERNRVYDVHLSNVDEKGQAMSIVHQVRGYGRSANSSGVKVEVGKNGSKRSYTLRVVGDIGKDALNDVLDVATDKAGDRIKYAVEVTY